MVESASKAALERETDGLARNLVDGHVLPNLEFGLTRSPSFSFITTCIYPRVAVSCIAPAVMLVS